jgi:hypothetical protein
MPRTEQAKHNKEHRDFQDFFGKWRAAKKEYVRKNTPPPQPPAKKQRKTQQVEDLQLLSERL